MFRLELEKSRQTWCPRGAQRRCMLWQRRREVEKEGQLTEGGNWGTRGGGKVKGQAMRGAARGRGREGGDFERNNTRLPWEQRTLPEGAESELLDTQHKCYCAAVCPINNTMAMEARAACVFMAEMCPRRCFSARLLEVEAEVEVEEGRVQASIVKGIHRRHWHPPSFHLPRDFLFITVLPSHYGLPTAPRSLPWPGAAARGRSRLPTRTHPSQPVQRL